MSYSTNILIKVALIALITTETALCVNLFYMPRIPSSCSEVRINFTGSPIASNNCLTYSWNEIVNLTTNYTTYIDPTTNGTYYAQIGALTVLGSINNYTLNYQCPPVGYNGAGSDCQTLPNTQLVVLKINAFDSKLYGIDIILSGAPFPAVQNLMNNQPPFGIARVVFDVGIPIQTSGYFQVCQIQNSLRCPNQNISSKVLPYPLPSNYGYGLFGIQSMNMVTNSTWIMDDPNQLLIVTAGTNYFYFNKTGYFLYNSISKSCTWSATCNYICEAYNYNSRFLDYAGQWIIINKWGYPNMKPVVIDAWIGNAIDAAGLFPIIMYTDAVSGHYIGLDKLDTQPTAKMGATYWYSVHGNTIPVVSVTGFNPSVVADGCVAKLSTWTGIQNAGYHLKSVVTIIMLAIVSLPIIQN